MLTLTEIKIAYKINEIKEYSVCSRTDTYINEELKDSPIEYTELHIQSMWHHKPIGY